MGRVGSGLGITWTWPDWIGLPKRQPTTDLIYGLDRRFGSSVERIEFINLTGLGFKLSHYWVTPHKPSVSSTQWWVFSIFSSHSISSPCSTTACLQSTTTNIQATLLYELRSTSKLPIYAYNPFSISANPHPPWPIHTQHTHTHLGRSPSTMPTPTLADPHPTYLHPPWLIYTHHANTHLGQSKSHIPTPIDPHLSWKYTWEPKGVERRVETRETWDWDLRVERTESDFWKSEILISET